MASVQIFTAEIRVQFQGRRCVMLVDVVHPRKDAVEPCKTVLSQCQTTQYCTGRWVGLRAGLDRQKISPPPGFDPRTVQPVVSRYPDWTWHMCRTEIIMELSSITHCFVWLQWNLRRRQLFLLWGPQILQSAALVFPRQFTSQEYSIEYSRHNSDPFTVAGSFVYLSTIVVCCCKCGWLADWATLIE